MTARNDLDNAFSILDAGIKAHVTALATAHAAVADESYIQGLTAKVLAMADELNASNPVVLTPVTPAAVIPSAPAPVAPVAAAPAQAAVPDQFVTQAPVAPVAPVVAPAAPVAPTAPGQGPSFLQNMAAEIAKIQQKVTG